MNKIIKAMNKFLKQMSMTDCGFLKVCVCAVGVLIGLNVPKKSKKAVGIAAGIIFLITYIPLMGKFFEMLSSSCKSGRGKNELCGEGYCGGSNSGHCGFGDCSDGYCGDCSSDSECRDYSDGCDGECGCNDCCANEENSIFEPEDEQDD